MKVRRRSRGTVLSLILLLFLAACGGQDRTTPPACASAPRPVVFVHGFLAGGDSFASAAMRFSSNGYCPAYLRVFDWNSLSLDVVGNAERLAEFVDAVLDETGATQVDLVGHSMGGRLSHTYLSDGDRAAKVAHYVHAASFCNLTFPETVPVLALSSDEDTVVGSCVLEGAQNQDIDGADHLQVVTLPEAFAAIYRFFNGERAPETTAVVAQERVTLSGKVLALGTNQPAAGAEVAVYAVDAATGERLADAPAARFTVAQDGTWGPLAADPAAFYEFEVSQQGQRPFHWYRQPFSRSNPLVYLRAWPESNPLLDMVLGGITYDDRSSNVVFFSANQALYSGRDSATLDGLELVTPEMAPPPPDPTSTIAIFIFDADGDGETDGGPVPLELSGFSLLSRRGENGAQGASEFPFLRQYDAFLPAGPRRTLTVTMNGATLHAPTWKADSEGPIVVVFDYGQAGP